MKKRFWTLDKLIGFVALFVSVMTLIIFIKQTNLMDKQSRLSVMPYLVIENSNNSEDNEFIIEVYNYGVGPAIIETKELFYNGSHGDIEFSDFIHSNKEAFDSLELNSYSTLDKGLAIPAGQSRTIAKVTNDSVQYLKFLKMAEILEEHDFNYIINYKSIYNDHWQIDIRSSEPLPLE